MRKIFIATIVVGMVSLAAFVLERLALTDIFHGEPDPRLEWTLVNAVLLPVVLFHVLGLVSVIIALRRLDGLAVPLARTAQQADAADRPATGC